MRIASYRDLIVWQKAMDYAELVYRLTRRFPREELFGLTSQLRKASASIPSNIAEGHGRRAGKEFIRFLLIANGSLRESETQLPLAERLRYVEASATSQARELAEEIGRCLSGLIGSLKKRLQRPSD